MRIFATADLHGRPDRVEAVRRAAAELQPDVVILAGDITHAGKGTEALALLDELPGVVIAIPGNMDTFEVDGTIGRSRARNPNHGVIEHDGVRFCGLRNEPCDVLVVHEPPYGVLDRTRTGQHIGSRSVRDFVLRLRPRLVVCGHVHESPGIKPLGETTVVNCTMGDDKTLGALVTWGHEPRVDLLPR
ncbi:MAG: metallophosphoesterase [Armatimonadota bacterium]|nr:metallophosphoesterase [Armatimonadota bacterium]MDR5697176.1 metallophosphoesterase [Armatimonadota bacterium]